jgi:hypothetical protein
MDSSVGLRKCQLEEFVVAILSLLQQGRSQSEKWTQWNGIDLILSTKKGRSQPRIEHPTNPKKYCCKKYLHVGCCYIFMDLLIISYHIYSGGGMMTKP